MSESNLDSDPEPQAQADDAPPDKDPEEEGATYMDPGAQRAKSMLAERSRSGQYPDDMMEDDGISDDEAELAALEVLISLIIHIT